MGIDVWSMFRGLDGPDFDPLNDFTYTDMYNDEVPAVNLLASLFTDHFEYDVLSDMGSQYPAVVIKVLSGPQSKTAALGDLTYTSDLFGDSTESPSLWQMSSKLKLKEGKIRVLAKVPPIHKLAYPKDLDDEFQMSLFPEFVAARDTEDDPSLASIKAGAIVWVSLPSPNAKLGTLIGVHSTNFIAKIKEARSALTAFTATCTLPKVCTPQEAKNLYAGNSSHEYESTGPPIRKIKGKIKTGVYGDGTEQTKTHFAGCLKEASASYKYKLSGPAPGPKNAFMWVGHLEGNGRGDLVDRPPGPGRETIIYASKTLDITEPIEIKYYFHDIAGFGYSWIHGPETTIAESENSVMTANNDLRTIAANLKDLIRAGRNFVLVIPEMLYSRGFGTKLGDSTRIKSYTKCTRVLRGDVTKTDLIRTNLEAAANSSALPAIRDYLSSVSEDATSNYVTSDRILSTFVKSGNLGTLHNEVIGILHQHISKNLEVGYVSILAEGAGALSLAAIPVESLESVPINRIDFIANGFDRLDRYNYFFERSASGMPGESAFLPNIPSLVLYNDFLLKNADINDLEFNYIVNQNASFSPLEFGNSDGAVHFFDHLDKGTEFQNNFNGSVPAAQWKFNFWIENNEANLTSIGCYVGGNKQADHAFSMINNELSAFANLPIKSDTVSRIGLDSVPNHAQKISAKQKSAAVSGYKAKREKHEKKIENFDKMLNSIGGGLNDLCKDPKYKVYCSQLSPEFSILKFGENSLFHKRYKNYINSKTEISKLDQLTEGHIILIEIGKDKKLIDERLKEYEDLLKESENGIEDTNTILTSLQVFKPSFFTSVNKQKTLSSLGHATDHIGRRQGIEEIIERLKEKQKSATPSECSLPERCRVTPIPLRAFKGEGAKLLDPALFTCSGANISAVKRFDQLSEWIPYYPKKDSFTFDGGMSVHGKMSSKKVDLKSTIPDYKTSTFKYKTRRGRDVITFEQSPPVWSCIAPIFEEAWEAACNASNYIPFKVTDGIKDGYADSGVFVSSYGLTINIDPFIAPFSKSTMSHSVFTGAWTPEIGDYENLTSLGVFKYGSAFNAANLYEHLPGVFPDTGPGIRRKIENLNGNSARGIPSAKEPAVAELDKYLKKHKLADLCKGNYILPPNANPTLWAIVFCEKSGAKWGNSQFLKRKQNGGTWTTSEKKFIAEVYGIPKLFERIKNISWPLNTFDNHSYFQFWSGKPLVTWDSIKKVAAAKGIAQ